MKFHTFVMLLQILFARCCMEISELLKGLSLTSCTLSVCRIEGSISSERQLISKVVVAKKTGRQLVAIWSPFLCKAFHIAALQAQRMLAA